ncbi:hypothetical protein G9P44_005714 [Scheffersomyces stipitis]|nr:hypothetical protein G9P44_005714 [Scheffersomyces stipitis]
MFSASRMVAGAFRFQSVQPVSRMGVSTMRYMSSSKPVQIMSSQIQQNSSNIELQPTKVRDGKRNEKVVMWKMYGTFHKHNTLASLVAVVEDLDFLEKNQHLSYNEKVLYYLQLPHHTKLHITAGQLGFRKSQRSEYEAAFQVATKMFKTIEEKNLLGPNDKIELIMTDYGKGRDAFQAALMGKEGQHIKPHIVRVSDATKLRFGGPRPKKLRRL